MNCSRDERGQFETRVYLQSLEHKMLSKKEWLAFFHNIKMKQHLLNLFVTYLSDDNFVRSSPLSILVNNEYEIFKIQSSVTKVFECNHEKADIRIIFQALQQKANSFFKRYVCSCYDGLCLCSYDEI